MSDESDLQDYLNKHGEPANYPARLTARGREVQVESDPDEGDFVAFFVSELWQHTRNNPPAGTPLCHIGTGQTPTKAIHSLFEHVQTRRLHDEVMKKYPGETMSDTETKQLLLDLANAGSPDPRNTDEFEKWLNTETGRPFRMRVYKANAAQRGNE